MLQSVKNSIKNHSWNLTNKQSEDILKIAKLLKKNQWIKVMRNDFDLNVTYNQSNEASDKPIGAYFSKGDWFATSRDFNDCKIAVVDINDKNIITLKNIRQIIEFAEEYGDDRRRSIQEPIQINWSKVAKDYDGMILFEINIPIYNKIYKDDVNIKLFESISDLEEELDIIRWKYHEKNITNKEKLQLEKEFSAKDDILQAKMIRAKEQLKTFQGDILDKTYKNTYWTKDYDVTTLVLFNTDPIKSVHMFVCKENSVEGDLSHIYKKLRKLLKK